MTRLLRQDQSVLLHTFQTKTRVVAGRQAPVELGKERGLQKPIRLGRQSCQILVIFTL